ncbi:sulfur carrier protein ThiS [Marseilla massiliensis]|uniref:sulfur carrier protein ThiS n=1 Tax=Marseilla massiliensis TaxID=1841864 RepID=UPI0020131C80|nr:sulfur carrier protein ThiS [Marseilla massiliensis]MCL1609766.1 sulfur carrier protein ThiS [Marseilla massiliensis]
MNVKINNEPAVLADGTTLAQLAAERNLPDRGVAVAVGNAMVPRAEWSGRTLVEGDDIVILKAFCGG